MAWVNLQDLAKLLFNIVLHIFFGVAGFCLSLLGFSLHFILRIAGYFTPRFLSFTFKVFASSLSSIISTHSQFSVLLF